MLFRNLIVVFSISTLLLACAEKKGEQTEQEVIGRSAIADRQKIDSLEQLIEKQTGKDNDKEMQQVLEALRSYQNYSVDYPKDSATAGYLLKSGQIYYSYLKDNDNALEYLNRLVDSFPQSRQRPVGLLLLGNAYHDIGDTARAMAALHMLESDYASTDYSRMAQELIDYIRRTTPRKEESTDQPPPGQEPKI